MKSHTETLVDQREMWLFLFAIEAVNSIPDGVDPDADGARCHEVARTIGRCLDLPVIDGKYGSVDHSWLLIEHPATNTRKILDVYCVARLPMVQLIDPHQFAGHGALYRPTALRTDIRPKVVRAMLDATREVHRRVEAQRKNYPTPR